MPSVLKTVENKKTSVTTHFQKLTTGKTCLLSQLLSNVTVTSCSLASNVQRVRLVNFLKCVVTEVVLFLIADFKTLDI